MKLLNLSGIEWPALADDLQAFPAPGRVIRPRRLRERERRPDRHKARAVRPFLRGDVVQPLSLELELDGAGRREARE
jgi:hypothetical protein